MCCSGPLCWLVGIVEARLFHFLFSFEHCFRRQWAWSRCNGRGEASQIIWIKIVSTQRERGLIHVLSSTSSFWDINGMSASSLNLFSIFISAHVWPQCSCLLVTQRNMHLFLNPKQHNKSEPWSPMMAFKNYIFIEYNYITSLLSSLWILPYSPPIPSQV